jgi:hypothetical protein
VLALSRPVTVSRRSTGCRLRGCRIVGGCGVRRRSGEAAAVEGGGGGVPVDGGHRGTAAGAAGRETRRAAGR